MRHGSGKNNKENHSAHSHNLAGDTVDPERKNRLHGVLKAVALFKTTSSRIFQGHRAKAEENLAGDTKDPTEDLYARAMGTMFSCGEVRILMHVDDMKTHLRGKHVEMR